MTLSSITVKLDSEAAKLYEETSPEKQAKIQLLFSILVREFSSSARSLEAIMDEIGEKAQELGLTEKKLRAMLDDK